MAGAIVPLVLAALPEIINLITGLVHHQAPIIESQHGPNTGPVKFADLFDFVKASLQKAAGAGQIDVKSMPSDDLLKIIIQSIVTSLNVLGMLDGSAAVPASSATPDRIVVTSGQSVLITVK